MEVSIKGLEQLIRTIPNVKQKINPGLNIAGILITMADMRTNYSREIIEMLHKAYDTRLRIFSSIVHSGRRNHCGGPEHLSP